MKKKNLTVYDNLAYIGIMLIANLIAAVAMLLLISILGKSNDRDMIIENYKLFAVIFAFVGVVASSLVMSFYFKRKLPSIDFSNSEEGGIKAIIKNFCLLVLPGEILRFVFASIPTNPGSMFGYRFFDGFLAMPSNLLYDWFYLMPNDRLEIIRKSGYTFADNALFILVYLIYFIVYIGILFLIFWRIWKENETARKNEVKLYMDYDQVK